MLTFAVERYGDELALFTIDVKTQESCRIGTLVSEEAVRSFFEILAAGKMVARAQGEMGI